MPRARKKNIGIFKVGKRLPKNIRTLLREESREFITHIPNYNRRFRHSDPVLVAKPSEKPKILRQIREVQTESLKPLIGSPNEPLGYGHKRVSRALQQYFDTQKSWRIKNASRKSRPRESRKRQTPKKYRVSRKWI